MRGKGRQFVRGKRFGLVSSIALAACLASGGLASAQDVSALGGEIPPGSQMLLESDVLTYDQDANTVTASGRVRIEYGGNRLVAERVVYDRKTSRLKALGDVEIIERSGNRIYTQEIDITDDFGDGFVNQLRVETPDKTYFAAESADRKGGMVTTFYNGVYTACEPCEEKPDKAPVWRVKARKTIWNGQKKTIRFEHSRFEMFGLPIAYLPAFEVPDPTVKRKSGFLIPSIDYDKERGVGVHVPYYFALSPTYDLTVTGHGYHRQGFLPEAVWRQRFNNGEYSVTLAGISQMNPEDFPLYSVDRGAPGDRNRLRGMIGTRGEFKINPRWTFGWKLLLQSDKNFSNTYEINNYSASTFRNEVYLTGLGERNFFDLRFMKFHLQEEREDDLVVLRDPTRPLLYSDTARNRKEAWVLPSLDYNAVRDEPVAGGQFSLNLNSRVIHRDEVDQTLRWNGAGYDTAAVNGVGGTDGRLTAEAEWKRDIITPGGLVVTPLLAFQAETRMADQNSASVEAIENMALHMPSSYGSVASDIRSAWNRYMATVGLELKWPVLFSSISATHVLEPTAQVFARPDEQGVEGLGLSNEDAQSFVFDASTLFERDKFSGYDRMEGGTRANLGVRYSGSYANGWATHALVGQSYHLAGKNSFAAPDLVFAGAESGLETDRSDYVAMVGFTSPFGLSAALSTRLDEQTFEARRTEAKVGYIGDHYSVNAKYAFIGAQPNYGQAEDRHEVSLNGRVKIAQYWQTFGSGTYDIRNQYVSKNAFGFGYADECFTFALTYSQERTFSTALNKVTETTQKVGFNLSFRTLGEFGSASSDFGVQQ